MPLQAADILAYELWRDIPRYFGTEKRSRRYPLQVLGAKPNIWSVVGEDNMRVFAEVITLGLEHSVVPGTSPNSVFSHAGVLGASPKMIANTAAPIADMRRGS